MMPAVNGGERAISRSLSLSPPAVALAMRPGRSDVAPERNGQPTQVPVSFAGGPGRACRPSASRRSLLLGLSPFSCERRLFQTEFAHSPHIGGLAQRAVEHRRSVCLQTLQREDHRGIGAVVRGQCPLLSGGSYVQPSRVFGYYLRAYVAYLLSPASANDADGASCFIGLIEYKLQYYPADIRPALAMDSSCP